MKYELFGISPIGGWDYLGTYSKEHQLFCAVDDYAAMGYKNIKFCTWK